MSATASPLRQLLLFAIAGVVGLVVDTAVLYALAPWLGWYAARVVSFLAAATTTWWINRRHAFRSQAAESGAQGLPWWREYAKYLASMTVGGLVNYAAYSLVLQWLHGPLAPMLGVAAGSVAGLAFNFAAARYLVFRR